MTLAEIATVVGGVVHGDPTATVDAPATVDSRAVDPGGLFVAVVGERVDGHAYAAAAAAAGAAAVLGSRATHAPTVVVDDPVVALGLLARHVRDRLPGVRVLALTGSQGKTGTKDYLAAILTEVGPTVATAGNLNNELGVPLTVLGATLENRYLVVEMGARHVGNIAYLCGIARPDVAAVLNVGTAHIGEFGSQEAIAQTKGEIVEGLASDGVAVLPGAPNPLTDGLPDRTRARVLPFGWQRAGGVWADGEVSDDLHRYSFTLRHGDESAPVRLGQVGGFQIDNATAAAAMAVAVGVDLATAAAALTAARPASRWRMEVHERPDGVTVINDAYNANPASMFAAIDTLNSIGLRGRRTVAVLGEMKELGDRHDREHHSLGGLAAYAEIDVIVVVGAEAAAIADGARAEPEWLGEVVVTAGRDEALSWLRDNVLPGDVVLVKASRGVALEHVADGLLSPHRGDHR